VSVSARDVLGSLSMLDLAVHGPAFSTDLQAAAVAAMGLGVPIEAVHSTIRAFEPAPHRRALVGTWDDVQWVDDSKATNPHAAVASATAYRSVVLIAGGRNKGLDLSPILAIKSIRHLILMGEAAPELAEAAGEVPSTTVSSIEEAVSVADAVSKSGDTVLLAPACASFDMFPSYAARGDAFVRAVRERKERR